MTEQRSAVREYEGFYEVSNTGKLRSCIYGIYKENLRGSKHKERGGSGNSRAKNMEVYKPGELS